MYEILVISFDLKNCFVISCFCKQNDKNPPVTCAECFLSGTRLHLGFAAGCWRWLFPKAPLTGRVTLLPRQRLRKVRNFLERGEKEQLEIVR